ncbi:DUF6143 family protein [Clostridium sp.]|uniref:DUF6143 family protein n=1 Tax=Clostridium sp. TaxID=1506 RepID=UPI002615B9A5|nr:DUF6143 family protein [Clostridium sp.]
MLQENNIYMMHNKIINPQEVVSISVPLYKSIQGKYFVGQTGTLTVCNKSDAWASLLNPHGSGIDLFVNVFTISNFSDNTLTAEIWLNVNPPKKECISNKISPTNTALKPLPHNKAEIRFVDSTTEVPQGGVNVYERIVPPNTTLVGEEDGKFIHAPGGNYTIVIRSTCLQPSKVIVALGWWEKPIC